MPVFLGGMTIFGLQRACQNMFVALGQARISIFIALLRKAILLIPLALILPNFMGVTGVYALRLYLMRLRPSVARYCSFGQFLKFWEGLKGILCVWSNRFFVFYFFLLHRYAWHYGCILTVISLFISFPVRKC